MTEKYTEFRNTPLWRALAGVVTDLQASREITLGTAPDYVIAYLCQELVAKRVVAADALTPAS